MIVVDASLAAKLVIDEADSAAADRWFRDRDGAIVAPDLIAIEVAQAVVRRVNDRLASADIARTALDRWFGLLAGGGIELIRSKPADVAAAAGIAIRLGHPVKDCVYLAVAISREINLMTCDAKFAAKAEAAYPGVKLLVDNRR